MSGLWQRHRHDTSGREQRIAKVLLPVGGRTFDPVGRKALLSAFGQRAIAGMEHLHFLSPACIAHHRFRPETSGFVRRLVANDIHLVRRGTPAAREWHDREWGVGQGAGQNGQNRGGSQDDFVGKAFYHAHIARAILAARAMGRKAGGQPRNVLQPEGGTGDSGGSAPGAVRDALVRSNNASGMS